MTGVTPSWNSTESFESIVAQLHSPDWLVRGVAIRKVWLHPARAIEALPRLFELTFDEKAPLRSDSTAIIKRIGQSATPLLLAKTEDEDALIRARAIELIHWFHEVTSYRLIDQWLPERNSNLPDWAGCREAVMAAFVRALSDPDARVRFAAASACEELGWSLEETVPIFFEALGSEATFAQNMAALRLGRLGPMAKITCASLRRLADSPDRYVRRSSQVALQRIERA
jgi:hypothetical protein